MFEEKIIFPGDFKGSNPLFITAKSCTDLSLGVMRLKDIVLFGKCQK